MLLEELKLERRRLDLFSKIILSVVGLDNQDKVTLYRAMGRSSFVDF